MNATVERLYHRSPVALQNVLVSLYGLKLRRERYAPDAAARLADLRASERLDNESMRALLDARFAALAGHALRTVPYWREWAACSGAEPGDLRGLDDLARLPVVAKDEVRRRPDDFLSDAHRGRHDLIRLSTSGSTGTPLPVVCDRACRTRHYAFFSRLRGWYGLGPDSRRATLFGRIILAPDRDRPPFWRHDWFQRNLLLSSYHLAERHLPHYYAQLARYRPDEIIGYPSSLVAIARHILARGLEPLAPKVVFTTAETLLAHHRETLARAFACPIVDQYGCTEMAFFAAECEHGTMHAHPEHGWLEALDAAGQPVARGEPGLCVATGFLNEVMPLLRYQVGDVIALGPAGCPCGRPFPVLARIEGRVEDTLLTPDGRPLGRLDPVFKGRSGIVECQIVQTDPATLLLRVVPDATWGPRAEADLLREVRLRAGDAMTVTVEIVDAIPKQPNGKFKAVVRAF